MLLPFLAQPNSSIPRLWLEFYFVSHKGGRKQNRDLNPGVSDEASACPGKMHRADHVSPCLPQLCPSGLSTLLSDLKGQEEAALWMEAMDEFDHEFPQSVTFCQLISEEDYERQAATCTERALRRLFRSIDRNPALAERVAKFFYAVQGELNYCNSMDAMEMHQRLEHLKRSIHRVHLYAQDAKKKRRKPKLKKLEPILLRDRATSPCLPPPSLPPPLLPPPATTMASVVAPSPPVYTMPRVFGPFPPLSNKLMENVEVSSSEVRLNWTGLSSNPKSHMVDLTPLVLNPGGFHFSYRPGNSAHKLHCPGFPWTSTCSGSPSTEEMPSPPVKASIFTPPVLLKFQPVRRPDHDSENDPGSSDSVPHHGSA
ncbi:uncharacterized protein LOC126065945 isoform X3 [Elephas maximus indicus]|uniref:uncharacterized protein LOC126065945 isoform X3 n=1 Tax=Elephas maximus indicus TaxID=99487 RepID=UPI002116BE0C|nr:uncharacterized protein LOC126065945 isoform X3 [Elephas maximus indicus]